VGGGIWRAIIPWAVSVKIPVGDDKLISLKSFLYHEVFASWLSPVNASLAFAVTNVVFWLAIMWVLYRKQIFIKI